MFPENLPHNYMDGETPILGVFSSLHRISTITFKILFARRDFSDCRLKRAETGEFFESSPFFAGKWSNFGDFCEVWHVLYMWFNCQYRNGIVAFLQQDFEKTSQPRPKMPFFLNFWGETCTLALWFSCHATFNLVQSEDTT